MFNNPKLMMALSYDDVLLAPQYSNIDSRSEVDLTATISPNLKLKIPLITTNMDTVSGVEMALEMHRLGGMALLPRWKTPEEQAKDIKQIAEAGAIAAASIGLKEGEFERAKLLVEAGATVLNIDVAHGHMQRNIEFTKRIKDEFGEDITLIGGIAATGACAEDLYNAGADSLYVGVGGGSICTTRVQTGCGLPTLASLFDIAEIARKHNKTFIPCAGIKNSGDIVKSLAAGASAVAGGSIFSGTKETPGNIVKIDNKEFKEYNGSASKVEKERQVNKDNTGKDDTYTMHVEGVAGVVPYKGPVENIVYSLCAGIRSGMAYCGARTIEEIWEKAEFVQISAAGHVESRPHEVIVIEH